jgi:hypothetical protein
MGEVGEGAKWLVAAVEIWIFSVWKRGTALTNNTTTTQKKITTEAL